MDFDLVDPFYIDSGELDGLSLQTAFVLGVEWATLRERLASEKTFRCPVHAANASRLLKLCLSRDVQADFELGPDPEWVELIVGVTPKGGVVVPLPRRAKAQDSANS